MFGDGKGTRGDCGHCRALVHSGNNRLVLNYENDFTDGVSIGNPVKNHVHINKDGNLHIGGKFIMGGTEINENDLKTMKSGSGGISGSNDPEVNKTFTSLNKVLSSNEWTNLQKFNGGIQVNSSDLLFGIKSRGECGNCRALVHGPSNKLILNYDNDFNGGIEIRSNLEVKKDLTVSSNINGNAIGASAGNNGRIYIGPNDDGSNGKICIGQTCISEDQLKILTGEEVYFDNSVNNKPLDSGRGVSIGDKEFKDDRNNPYFKWRIRRVY